MNKKPKAKKGTFSRLIKLLYEFYPRLLPITIFCILFSAASSAVPDLYIQKVMAVIEKWYMTGDWASAYPEVLPLIITLSVIYVISLAAVYIYTQLMAVITQGFLGKMRCKMFDGMQNLPVRFFDTNKHGEIMSYYTNDIDTLRQLISQAIPSILRAGSVVICVLGIMLYFSVWMTLVVLIGVVAMTVVSKKFGGGSAKYFIRQQRAMGKAEGFIQEMMNGQKVIKVFCHEKEVEADFEKVNNELFEDSSRAHAYANILGPIIGNIGNILYVLVAIAGGIFYITKVPNVSFQVWHFQ